MGRDGALLSTTGMGSLGPTRNKATTVRYSLRERFFWLGFPWEKSRWKKSGRAAIPECRRWNSTSATRRQSQVSRMRVSNDFRWSRHKSQSSDGWLYSRASCPSDSAKLCTNFYPWSKNSTKPGFTDQIHESQCRFILNSAFLDQGFFFLQNYFTQVPSSMLASTFFSHTRFECSDFRKKLREVRSVENWSCTKHQHFILQCNRVHFFIDVEVDARRWYLQNGQKEKIPLTTLKCGVGLL